MQWELPIVTGSSLMMSSIPVVVSEVLIQPIASSSNSSIPIPQPEYDGDEVGCYGIGIITTHSVTLLDFFTPPAAMEEVD